VVETSAPEKQGSKHHWQTSKELIPDMHISFQILYVHNFKTELCKQQAKVIQHHENIHVRNMGKAKADKENIRDLNLGVVRHMII
jgi:hypothetical protein